MTASGRMTNRCVSWLKGIVDGDGFIDDRHVEIHNSSEDILKETLKSLQKIGIPNERIKIDVYGETQSALTIWRKTLPLAPENFKLRKNTSPWKSNKTKVRIRVASKDLVNVLKNGKMNNSYVKGFFDAEASVDVKGYIEIKQKSTEKGKRLVIQAYKLLTDLGIACTTPKTKRDRDVKVDAYFYVKDLKTFSEKIGFTDSEKKEKTKLLIKVHSKYRKTNISKIVKLKQKGMGSWDIIREARIPYHRMRETLKKHHAIRQTR